ncbi:MAG TPA: NAD(P)H-dependent oxidoreductase subunit E [Candidatus Baltobacteraceae bacterium]|nr:NAD(P)H-dependent oxidoreductase subunit E [Candidatus Baltobacteraceae bacterium]
MPDLHFTSAAPTLEERDAIDACIASKGEGRRDLLLPVLHAINDRVGWISEGALNYACERLAVAPAEAYGVATFYAMFSTAPRPPTIVHVCDDVACRCAGAEDLCRELEAAYGPSGTQDANASATWLRSPCLGLCDRAPAALVTIAGSEPAAVQTAPANAALLDALLASGVAPSDGVSAMPHVGGSMVRLLQRAGNSDPESLDAYRERGGYQALRKAFELGPQRIVEETIASNLLGRGGAAFPTGRKMQAVAAQAARPHYLVCNADESEPGTFKDRVIMERDPFALIEAMTIAAYAAGCERGFIYVRGEYPLAARRLQTAIDAARSQGLLGENVLASGFSFDVEIRRGAGAYICGEETALFNSIEGKRGEPRSKPPFPVEVGLFGKPTLINNVETLANLPHVVLHGGAAYAATGTKESTGTRLFCLSGTVRHPGLYEVGHGTTLGDLVDMAGGVSEGRTLQAILLGGAAGSLVGPDALPMRLTFEDARAAGATLGSGVVMLFDDTIDVRDILKRIAQFFREESCGQCVPCRVGTVRQEEALERLDVTLLNDIGRAMRDASICGLGQTAANAIASGTALRILPSEAKP